MLNLATPDVTLFRFTRDEYYRTGELGWFNDK